MLLAITDPLVGLAGDWHGYKHPVGPALAAFAARHIEYVFHVGDFGLIPGPDGDAYLHHVNRMCHKHNITLYVTPGNHDNWAAIIAATPGADGLLWFADRVAVMPRGYRWTVADKTFVSLGGAASVDRADLTPGADWWPEETIGYGDALATLAAGPADVMITHDAPDGDSTAVQRVIDRPGLWPDDALADAAQNRAMLTGVWHGLQPDFLVHGHYHLTAHEKVNLPSGKQTQIMSLNQQDKFGNLAILDVTAAPMAAFIKT